jgi:L-ascorbate metabolism protein UlaG (beta-lactamase superfamily)
MDVLGLDIKWLGHDGFRIKAEKVVYFDPFKLKNASEPADLILITHEHFDHCSPSDIEKISTPNTQIVTVADCFSKLAGMKVKSVTTVEPGNRLKVQGVEIEVVPAYNINKKFHPKENLLVGFVVTLNGKRVYHAGDTDKIPEMANLKNIDIALVPVSGTYTMTAEEAAAAVNLIKPKVAIPMHYGEIIGTVSDAQKFKSLCKCEVVLG